MDDKDGKVILLEQFRKCKPTVNTQIYHDVYVLDIHAWKGINKTPITTEIVITIGGELYIVVMQVHPDTIHSYTLDEYISKVLDEELNNAEK